MFSDYIELAAKLSCQKEITTAAVENCGAKLLEHTSIQQVKDAVAAGPRLWGNLTPGQRNSCIAFLLQRLVILTDDG